MWTCAMSAKKQEDSNTMEQACMLCRRAAVDPDLYGHKKEKEGLCAHLFCLLFANQLPRQRDEDVGLMGFLPADIHRTVEQAAQKQCFVCSESGAAITCYREGCNRSFHLPCAVEGECVTQYYREHSSFCRDHRPEQEVKAAPKHNTICVICQKPVEDRKSYHTMVCPACKRAWFHRGCIQGRASCAGIAFRCPLCRDRNDLLPEMLFMGINIPLRLPSRQIWQEERALIEHRRCDAEECLCRRGRQQAEERGPWQLLLCSSCAGEGTHRRCSNLGTSRTSWECECCAGQSSDSSDSSEIAGPGTGSHSRSGPSHDMPALETSSPGTSSQSGSGPSQDSPVLEESSCPSPPGPMRMRLRSLKQRQAQTPYSQPRGRQGRSRAPARGAKSSTPGQAAPGLSHGSTVPASSSPSTTSQLSSGSSCDSPAPESGSCSSRHGPMRMQDRSRVELRAQTPYSQRGRRRGTSRAPSPHVCLTRLNLHKKVSS